MIYSPGFKILSYLGLFVLGILACLGGQWLLDWDSNPSPTPSQAPTPGVETEEITLPQAKWSAAGVKIAAARYAPLHETLWRTGKLALNEERLAHIAPMVEGIVREVKVRLGQDVQAGDVLAVLDCKEAGQAKLELAKSQMQLAAAKAQLDWVKVISQNVEALLEAMQSQLPIAEIEKRFQGKAIGDWRQQLVTAYARRHQLKTQLANLQELGTAGAVSQANLRATQAEYETAEATYQALREEIRFQHRQHVRTSEQKYQDALAALALSQSQLYMLGFSKSEVERMEPLAERESVAHYPIRAPFAGTVLSWHAVRSERVGQAHQLFELADLSTIWVQVDVPETDVAWTHGMGKKTVHFRMSGKDEELYPAAIFSAGHVVDKGTRAVTLSAVAANPQRRLKPGAFVEVRLQRSTSESVVQIPASAVVRHGNQTFVFLYEGGAKFRRKEIRPGRTAGDWTEIREGLTPQQSVVVEGTFALKSEMLRSQLSGE